MSQNSGEIPTQDTEYIHLRELVAKELLDLFGISIQDYQDECAERIMQRLWPEITQRQRCCEEQLPNPTS